MSCLFLVVGCLSAYTIQFLSSVVVDGRCGRVHVRAQVFASVLLHTDVCLNACIVHMLQLQSTGSLAPGVIGKILSGRGVKRGDDISSGGRLSRRNADPIAEAERKAQQEKLYSLDLDRVLAGRFAPFQTPCHADKAAYQVWPGLASPSCIEVVYHHAEFWQVGSLSTVSKRVSGMEST